MSEEPNKEGLKKVWLKIWTLVKTLTGDVDVSGKGTLQAQIDNLSAKTNECFQSASEGKSLVANAITGKGVTTSADDTFATMADNIGKIKSNPTLQSKSAALHTGQTSVTMKPDSGYDGLSQATATITLQEKTAALSTAAQTITPDSGKVISKVTVPAVTGTAGTGDVLSGKTFSSGSAGVNKTGTLADKTGTAEYTVTPSLDSTNGELEMPIPATGKYSTSNKLKATFATIASLIGLTSAKIVKGNTILNVSGNSNNMDTSGADAAAADILSGKKAGVKGSLITGSMANKAGTTVDAGSTTQDSTYTYLGIPSSGYYSSGSKVRAKNSDLGYKNVIEASAGKSGGIASITVPSGVTSGILIVVIAGWQSGNHSYNLSGNGISTKTTITSDTSSGRVNESVLSIKYEIDKCNFNPGQSISARIVSSNYNSYPIIRLFLIY